MRKSIISFLAMVMVVGLLIGCNSGGGSGTGTEPIYVAPKFDATGTWNVEATGVWRRCIEGKMEFCKPCDQLAEQSKNYYSNITLDVIQTDDQFTMYMRETEETESGYIEYDIYNYSNSRTEIIENYTVTMEYYGTMTVDNKDYFTGSTTYEIYVSGHGLVCSFTIGFQGWREGVFDPFIKIDPLEYDYGIVELGKTKSATFTVTNNGNPIYADPLELTWVQGMYSEDNVFRYDWDNSDPNSMYIERGQSKQFIMIYNPNTWPSEDFHTIIFSTNDPNTPEIRIELKGKATDQIPSIELSSNSECEKLHESDAINICFEDQFECDPISDPKFLTISNTGSLDLTITTDENASRCYIIFSYNGISLADSYLDITLKPGEFIDIEITFQTDWSLIEGRVEGGVWFYTNDPNNKDLYVRAYGNNIGEVPNTACDRLCY